MKPIFVALVSLVLSTGCVLDRLNDSLEENRRAVESSTAALERHEDEIEGSTHVLERNTSAVENSTTRLGENTRAVEDSTPRIERNTGAVQASTRAVESNAEAVRHTTEAVAENTAILEQVREELARSSRSVSANTRELAATRALVASLDRKVQALDLAGATRSLVASAAETVLDGALQGASRSDESSRAVETAATGAGPRQDALGPEESRRGAEVATIRDGLREVFSLPRSLTDGGVATILLAALYFLHQWSWQLLEGARGRPRRHAPLFSFVCYQASCTAICLLGVGFFALRFLQTVQGGLGGCRVLQAVPAGLGVLFLTRILASRLGSLFRLQWEREQGPLPSAEVDERAREALVHLRAGRLGPRLSIGIAALLLIALAVQIGLSLLADRTSSAFHLLLTFVFLLFGLGVSAVTHQDDLEILLGEGSGLPRSRP